MLKQINLEKRALFLSLFTQELIQQSRPKIEIQEVEKEIKEGIVKPTIIEKEPVPLPAPKPKIPKKIPTPVKAAPSVAPAPYEITSKITLTSTEALPIYPRPIRASYPRVLSPTPLPTKPRIPPKIPPRIPRKPVMEVPRRVPGEAPLTKPPLLTQIKQPTEEKRTILLSSPIIQEKYPAPQPTEEKRTILLSSPIIQKRYPVSQPIKTKTGGVDLGKLNVFLSDKEITTIECPGPEKLILIKKVGKINLTKIKLSKEEVDKIIKNFAESARIPLLGGVFKAVIGDLTISAVTSELVGSRFIIYRKTPYSIVEQGLQQGT